MSSTRSLDAPEFTRSCAQFATGITVAGVCDAEGVPHGLTVNSFASVSLSPPLILVCIAHSASTIEAFRQATHFGISVLAEDQHKLSDRFSRKGLDRFEGMDWYPGQDGVPLLSGALATFECAVHQRIVCGDHDIVVGEVLAADAREGNPLVYFGSRYRYLA